MRILHLIHTPRHSGAEILVRDLCLQHVNNGVDCAIAAFSRGTDAFQGELDNLARAGVKIYAPPRPNGRLGRLLCYIHAIWKYKPDAIFGHSLFPAAYGRAAAVLTASKAPFVKVLHSSTDDYARRLVRIVERLLQFRTDLIFTVAPDAANYYRARFSKTPPIKHVANGVNLIRFIEAAQNRPAIRSALGLAPKETLLVQIGRLSQIKNQKLTLSSLATLLASQPSWKFWFVGIIEDAEYARQLLADIELLGLGERVTFLGPRGDIAELVAAADLYIMPSEAEAHSIAFLEAMASGVPIIASNIPAFAFAEGLPGVTLIDLAEARVSHAVLAEAVSAAVRVGGRFKNDMTGFDMAQTARAYEDVAALPN